MESEPGIEINVEFDSRTDWTKFAQDMLKLTTKGIRAIYTGGIESADIIGTTSDAISSFVSSMKIESSPGRRAWELFCLSFAWSFDQLRADGELQDQDAREIVREALDKARVRVAAERQVVPLTFLARPVTLGIYKITRDEFCFKASLFKSGIRKNEITLKSKMDAFFNRAVFEIWSRKPELFRGLENALLSPGAAASAFERQWDLYKRRLVHEFEVNPVFGQEKSGISLSQLYVSLRGRWIEEKNGNEDDRIFLGKSGEPSRTSRIVNLDNMLDAWLRSRSNDDCLRLIGGGPGSGKSTTAKALARRAADRSDWRVLFIPLQHIDLEIDLRDAVHKFLLQRTDGAFRQPPLAREAIEDGPDLLLIFDGLDELARPGEGADDVAGLFISKLNQLLFSLRGEASGSGARRIRVVVTGRLPVFQVAKRLASAGGHRSVEVCGFLPRPFASDKDSDEDRIARRDQRLDWWARFSAATGADENLPLALKDSRLSSITDEPLLCYLLAVSGYAVENWEEAANNRNRIYERLIDEVWRRGWGDGQGETRRLGPGKALNLSDFNKLMQTIAFAAWRGGDTRVATESGFQESRKLLNTEDAWLQFTRDNGPHISNLALNFYLKSTENSHRGFEFTHKSFGDYLAARAILMIFNRCVRISEFSLNSALQEWFSATGSGALSGEILNFMRDEARRAIQEEGGFENIEKLKRSVERLVSEVLRQGIPSILSNEQGWRIAEARHRNSEITLWGVANSIVRALARSDEGKRRRERNESIFLNISWPNAYSFCELIQRCYLPSEEAEVILQCFSHVSAEKSYLYGLKLNECDLSGANLEKSNLNGAHLMGADLSMANLSGVYLQRAHLDRTQFVGANLAFADLRDARLFGTNFRNARLSSVKFSTGILLEGPKNLDFKQVWSIEKFNPPQLTKNKEHDIIAFIQYVLRKKTPISDETKEYLRNCLKYVKK